MPKHHSLKVYTLLIFVLTALQTQAIRFAQTNLFFVAEADSIIEENWISAQTIEINGAVSNDLFASATDINLNGTFHEDVWLTGDEIITAGVFENSARFLSRIAQIRGTHYGSVIAAGTTVKIDRTAILYDDLLCLGEHVIIEGSVRGHVKILAQRVTLGGQFNDNLSVTAQEIIVLPGTILNGNLSYSAPDQLVLPSSVLLNGELERKIQPVPTRRLFKEYPAVHFVFALAALGAGLVFSSLFPRYTDTTLHLLRESRGVCLLAGFAGLVVLPMAAFFIFWTIIGIPLSILVLLFYLILLYLSKITVALWIGSAILRRNSLNRRMTALPMALGLIVIYTATGITAVGMAANIIVTIFGLGALLIALFKKPMLVIPASDVQPTHKEV